MKHFIFTTLLLLVSHNTYAMDESSILHRTFRLPTKEILEQRFATIPECSHFIKERSIIGQFADQEAYPRSIFPVINFEKDNYKDQFTKDPDIDRSIFVIETLKPRMVELILQDHPDAIQLLKDHDIMTDPIQMESVDILRTQLLGIPRHFINESGTVAALANQKKYPIEIYGILVDEMEKYLSLLKDPMTQFMTHIKLRSLFPTILKAILQNHPKAVEWLTQKNWLPKITSTLT